MKQITKHISGVANILLSFSPWIAYSLLVGSTFLSKELAVLVAIILTVILNFNKVKKAYILDLGTIIFFASLAIAIFFWPNAWFVQNTNTVSNIVIAMIVVASIIVRKPFTLQYAKESTPEFLWKAKGFLKVNYTISYAWALSFILISFFQIGAMKGLWSRGAYFIAEIVIYIAVIQFTQKYPDWVRAKRYWKYRENLKPLDTPFLKNNYKPMRKEIFKENLTYEGEIPNVLNGEYMRNGPNPEFEQFSYNYPFDGDAMIHALYFDNGKVSYRNRFVMTPELEAERTYGKAIYGSIMDAVKPDSKLLPKNSDRITKAGAFINVLKLGQEYLAMHESLYAYSLNRELETSGQWHPKNDQRNISINAHARIDPVTQEMYAISYSTQEQPYLTLYHLDKDGNLLKEIDIEKDHPTMIHDFVMTENYIVIIVTPVVFDFKNLIKGESVLQWKPELGTNIALIPRKDLSQKPTWIKAKPFFVYHFSNAFERDNKIEIIGAHHEKFDLKNEPPSYLTKTIIDLKSKQVSFKDLGIKKAEFMRINDQYQGKQNRYTYVPTYKNYTFSTIIRYDDQTGEKLVRDFTGYELSEPVFIPEKNAKTEDEGYLAFFAYHNETKKSQFYILKAHDFLGTPQAIIEMPQRVPNGLHGNFFPSGD